MNNVSNVKQVNFKKEPSQLPELVPVPMFAEYLGSSEQLVRDLIHSGELPGIRVGRRLYVQRDKFYKQVEEGLYSC